jgi:hypothetical protein
MIENFTKDSTDVSSDEVKNLVDSLTNPNPEKRILIEEANVKVEAVGNDSYKENIIFTHYVNKPGRSRRIFRAKKSTACLPSEGK